MVYPDLARTGNNGVIGTSMQVVIPQATFTGWDMPASCSSGTSIVLQVWTSDSEQDPMYIPPIRSSKLVTQQSGASGCSLTDDP